MPNYIYKAFDSSEKIIEGELEATDKNQAMRALKSMSLKVIRISAKAETEQAQTNSTKKGGGEKIALALFKKLQQLCGGGGLPAGDAMKSLASRSLDPRLKNLSRELYRDLSEGKTLASAMERFPDTFDSCMVHLVEAGESTANLEFVFTNIIKYIEERRQLRATIISALAYPIFLCVLAIGIVLLFLFFMLPKIKLMMSNMGAEKNFPIQMMEFIGDALTYGVPVVAIIGLIAYAILRVYRKSESGLCKSDALTLKIPLIGKIVFDTDLSRYATLASTLFASGVNTTETFKLTEKAIKNADIRARFQQFRTAVNDGAPISAALQRYKLLDNEDIDIISVGERTGSLIAGFAEIAKTHTQSLSKGVKLMTAMLGGVALSIAFLLVLVFALGIVLSILGLSQSITT